MILLKYALLSGDLSLQFCFEFDYNRFSLVLASIMVHWYITTHLLE